MARLAAAQAIADVLTFQRPLEERFVKAHREVWRGVKRGFPWLNSCSR